MSQVFVQSFEHLKDKPNADRALETLKRVASLVKPIMRKRGWNLPVLAEFFPDNPSLLGLNVNMGQKILVRLRPYHSPDWFFPMEDIIGTMLHELTHNVHGPHDDKFYKYLDGLQDEYDALQRSGYAGEGFYSEGKRLGAGVSRNLPVHQARQKALEAAQKRMQISAVLGGGTSGGGGGRRLGGFGSSMADLPPRELAARAAERRLKDEKSCASGEEGKREVEKAAKESVTNKQDVIDLTLSDDETIDVGVYTKRSRSDDSEDEVIIVDGPTPREKVTNGKRSGIQEISSGSSPSSSSRSVASKTPVMNKGKHKVRDGFPRPPAGEQWACLTCTLVNEALALQCDACGTTKPRNEKQGSPGWDCIYCGEVGMPHEHWICRFCGEMKLRS